MKFCDMEYRRPALEEIKSAYGGFLKSLEEAGSFEQAERAYLEADKTGRHISSMSALCYIRHDIDTRDEFYAAEMDFFDQNGPVFEEWAQDIGKALVKSPFKGDFDRKYGDLLTKNVEIALEAFSPEIISEMQKENALVTEYGKLIASAKIAFEGETYTLSQLSPIKESRDDARRRAAWEAEGRFFMENADKLDGIYTELAALRQEMGQKLGFESFTELGYRRMMRNSYTKEDVERFREEVVRTVVPAAERIYRARAKRMGFDYPMSYADAIMQFESGNPRPQGGPDDIMAAGRDFYHGLSNETTEFIDFMIENGLFDVLSREGKAVGGFCTEISDYESPFIFANFNGTSHDVEVMTHEAGHAFAAYEARGIIPSDYQSPTLEACEIHSMTMEFFGWSHAAEFFGKDAEKFKYSHLSGAITFIPYGVMVDHFQHIVYENPGMSAAGMHGEWRRLMGIYTPWIDPAGMSFYGEGRGWQRQTHIYQAPFYYIDYCLAQSVALQFFALMQKDRQAAWEKYHALVKMAGTKTFTELVVSSGLKNPFAQGALKEACEMAGKWLDGVSSEALR